MRTPLSAAAMGLSLLQDDMLDDDDGAGASLLDQHGDVLRMVQTSFKKAETICADLLQVRTTALPGQEFHSASVERPSSSFRSLTGTRTTTCRSTPTRTRRWSS